MLGWSGSVHKPVCDYRMLTGSYGEQTEDEPGPELSWSLGHKSQSNDHLNSTGPRIEPCGTPQCNDQELLY